MYTKSAQNKKIIITLLLTLIIIVSLVCITFVMTLHKVTHSETERYLTEISESVSTTINVKCKSIFKILYSIGDTYFQFSDNNKNVTEYLSKKSKLLEFDWLGIVNSNGSFIGTDESTGNVKGQYFYRKALQGEETITPIKSQSGIYGILYSVPLYKNDKIVGAVTAWNTLDTMRTLLSVESFGGEGFSQIIDKNGNFIVSSDNKNAPKNVVNFFDTIKKHGSYTGKNTLGEMKANLKENKKGSMYFTLDDGIYKAMHYVPLEEENLYLLSIVPVKVANAQFDLLLKKVVFINILIIILFLLLIISIIFINRKNREQLIKIAYVDPVTKGYSKARFDMEAKEIIQSSSSGTYSLVSINIQKFKLINDSFGSDAGDKTLKYIHDVIANYLERKELLCRVSNDQFNILIKTISQKEILKYIENITNDINSFNKDKECKYFIALSIGVYKIDDPNIPLVSIQDRSNVARKNIKGNAVNHPLYTCVFYSDLERLRMLKEKEMENRMEEALDNNEFVVYLQPKVDLKNNNIVGAEALVRWQDPDKGLIPPNDFIPFFEKNGFIIKLDHYVFEKSCAMIRKWIDNGETPIPISVNFSRAHLNNKDFLKKYKTIRDKYDVPAKLLEIELTETLVFDNLQMLLNVIDQIHEEGFQCSLDDFGSGYSSLNMLKEIKVDTLKLDRAFFSAPNADNISENHVIESVVELAKKLNMNSISEGVETILQMEYLKKINCDMIQGYVFSKPIPQEIFEKMAFGKTLDEVNTSDAIK
ncbi:MULTISPECIES: EAL domain-containing protein [unclassified Clostridioides]|uniref:bifunctional diguanylate cyclase/phosphodiesterase n=1 Tax=unclassified Clostridioides TaxID=2635829 RepID=UPI001D124EB3|nr:EAL domain-containing protein [Clostridioides sp. ZZV14-6150]MCC0660758.1 EAL domain-containing protein [Clostridioides sp. ZZV14-6154]MCC0663877.1 EAL domain-containing protein [Clostridioides sp. ZZV15-6597]MCC0668080.1 EAL domain-containing protein [Clostridioides sp. ZZV14-6153]MCC0717393.1 EAL domain-containing protein [Clostridioides sp. ZZV14-6105]MCC0721480.1 EAL domain-containing protein [Clostridioides sp. ZZV14-6104]MCC0727889.1 EAL domain-containing protein [Clostridioides sp. 